MNTGQQLPLSIAAALRHALKAAMQRRSNRTFGFAHDEMRTDSPGTE
jgi:hypothetical protein